MATSHRTDLRYRDLFSTTHNKVYSMNKNHVHIVYLTDKDLEYLNRACNHYSSDLLRTYRGKLSKLFTAEVTA